MKTKDEIFHENIGIVHKVVNDKFKYFKTHVLFEDLLQEGCLGLVKAINGFDESKGFKFSTYAYNTVWGYISKYIQEHIYERRRVRQKYEEIEKISLFSPVKDFKDEALVIESIEVEDENFNNKEKEIFISELLEELNALTNKRYSLVYEVVLLRYLGYDNAKIAECLNISKTSVINKFNLAKEYFNKGEYHIAN